jgi:hypothetical protein
MKFAPKLVVHRNHGAVDIADQAVAEHHLRNLPVASGLRMRQRRQADDARGLAARLTTRAVSQPG